MSNLKFDIVVIGGGHAGIEAVHISAKLGLNVALVTMPGVPIGSAPCNPSIGGVGKGQVVREIDLLGGLMGRLADKSGIQYRTLNDSKGFAVQSTRVQIDKDKYSEFALAELENISNINIIYGKVSSINASSGKVCINIDDFAVESKKVILTVGTFSGGITHRGPIKKNEGRLLCTNSGSLKEILKNIDLKILRFKTGTPARLEKNTIKFEKLVEQPSDDRVENFSFLNDSKERNLPQLSCYLAHTNSDTLKIIRENKEKSPMYNGQISAVGARYCPSIEDKAYRYPDKDIHHVFLEPEGLDSNSYYPSGISTSLPSEVQDLFLKTIDGLENSVVITYGYAVEYDVIDTTQLNYGLSLKNNESIYFAGQVNGTSGYEEAAAQGLIAGINASFSILGKDEFVLSRNESYIGVMISDLVTNDRDEPYRLFTARSENRLFIREDNVALRMSEYRKMFNLSEELDKKIEFHLKEVSFLLEFIENTYFSPKEFSFLPESVSEYVRLQDKKTSVSEIIRQSYVDPCLILKSIVSDFQMKISDYSIKTAAITTKYSGYIKKADQLHLKVQKLDEQILDIDKIMNSKNISFECRQRIGMYKPSRFGQLKRMNGIRPATLALIASGNL